MNRRAVGCGMADIGSLRRLRHTQVFLKGLLQMSANSELSSHANLDVFVVEMENSAPIFDDQS